VLSATGAAVRHIMNVRFTYRRWIPALTGTVAAGAVALYLLVAFGDGGATPPRPAVAAAGAIPVADFPNVRSIVDRRCTACHSRQPSDRSFGVAPGGVAFDTPAQIAANAARIRERAIVTRTMPPGNTTGMTEEERHVLARWLEDGAPLR